MNPGGATTNGWDQNLMQVGGWGGGERGGRGLFEEPNIYCDQADSLQ